ncbi:hypothetical protein NDU88_006009 [Pleurodeles waltl]|uniref:Uncharacterized protein n=1 Tax=Pleurodeles waltl TaxID=8319 RepID=A0AAV7UJT7_PLEWA|nr:hypothetical protein NDU88_006009 [Pleurodeles waltl]
MEKSLGPPPHPHRRKCENVAGRHRKRTQSAACPVLLRPRVEEHGAAPRKKKITGPFPLLLLKWRCHAPCAIELEVARRKKLAQEYAGTLNKQIHLFQNDLKCQEGHYVLFDAALREVVRLLETLRNMQECETSDMWSEKEYQRLLTHMEAVYDSLPHAATKECHRVKAWGLLGEGTGARLLSKDRTKCFRKEDLIASDGSVRATEMITVDPGSGLLIPTSDTVMLLSSNQLLPVPNGYFVHPGTGRVLPIAGNVGYDLLSSQFVPTADPVPGNVHCERGRRAGKHVKPR